MTSATKILRRMLDERGVEWWQKKRHTCWKVGKGQEVEMWRAWEAPDGSLTLKVDYIYGLTPEQAIAATLGPAARHPKPHEQWTTVLLPEIAWGWDDRWPDYLSVAHDANGEWRAYVPEATLGAGTCHVESSIIDTPTSTTAGSTSLAAATPSYGRTASRPTTAQYVEGESSNEHHGRAEGVGRRVLGVRLQQIRRQK